MTVSGIVLTACFILLEFFGTIGTLTVPRIVSKFGIRPVPLVILTLGIFDSDLIFFPRLLPIVA